VEREGHDLVSGYESIFWVSNGMPEGNISEKDQRKLDEANTIFVGYILGVLIVITWLMCTCT